jgi:hypothetical protein
MKRKQLQTTLLLGVLFAALLTWVVFTQRGRVPEKQEAFGLQVRDITKLQVVFGKEQGAKQKPGTTLTLEKSGKDWYITEPIQGLADPQTVEQMLKEFAELKVGRRPDQNPDDPKFGAADPVLTVTGWWAAGAKSATLAIGKEAPLGSKRYAKMEGQQGLYLVPSSLKTTMAKDVDGLRDRRIARVKPEEILRATVAFGEKSVSLERTGGPAESPADPMSAEPSETTDWRLVAPVKAGADGMAVSDLLAAITSAEAVDFAPLPQSPSGYGLDSPQVSITLETKQGTTVISLGKQARVSAKARYGAGTEQRDVVYAERQGRDEVLLLDASLLKSTRKDEIALRDRRVARFKPADVLRLKVETKDRYSFEVARQGQAWRLTSAGGQALQPGRIDSIISELTGLEATSYLDGQPPNLREYGLALPGTVISIWLRGRSEPVKLSFGNRVQGSARVYLQTSEAPHAYEVSDGILKALPKSLQELSELAGMPDMGRFSPPAGPPR